MPDLLESLGNATGPVGIGLGLLQAGIGIVGDIKAKKEQKKLLAQQKAYVTPDELYDVLRATEQNAQSGYDPTTLNYLTNQTNQSFASSIGAATRLGGDPNLLSSIFAQNVDEIGKIASNNAQLQMEKFSQYLGAENAIAASKAAEQKSEQEILRNKLQAAGLDIQSSIANIGGGFSTILAGLSASGISNLYNPDGTLKVKKDKMLATTVEAQNAQRNAQNTRGYNP